MRNLIVAFLLLMPSIIHSHECMPPAYAADNCSHCISLECQHGELVHSTMAFDLSQMAAGQIAGIRHCISDSLCPFATIQLSGDGNHLLVSLNGEAAESIVLSHPLGAVWLQLATLGDQEARFMCSLDNQDYFPIGASYSYGLGDSPQDHLEVFACGPGAGSLIDPANFTCQVAPRLVALFIGDSITDGNWGNSKGGPQPSQQRTHWDMNHIQGHGYMNMCASHFQSLFPQLEMRFYNRGISGNTLADLESRWETDVLALNPDCLSILIGTNDVNEFLGSHELGASFDVDEWGNRYQALLDAAKSQNHDVKFMLCTPFVANTGNMRKTANYAQRDSLVRALAEKVKELAAHNDAILVDFAALFDTILQTEPNISGTYWIWDGIHPTMAGHRRMADLWISLAAPFITQTK